MKLCVYLQLDQDSRWSLFFFFFFTSLVPFRQEWIPSSLHPRMGRSIQMNARADLRGVPITTRNHTRFVFCQQFVGKPFTILYSTCRTCCMKHLFSIANTFAFVFCAGADQHGTGELRSRLKRTTLLPSLQGSVPLPSTYPHMALYTRMRWMKNYQCSCNYRTCTLIFARMVPWQVVSIFILVIVGILYAHLSSQASRKIAARKLKSSMPWLKNG